MGKKKNNLEVFLSSNTGKRFFNIFYSWGAAVVILGALFKILHLPLANQMLMIGMITEALVFFISGFDNSADEPVERVLHSPSASVHADRSHFSPEYSEKMSVAAKSMEDFANTMNSINQVSLSLLASYKEISDSSQGVSADSQNFSNNIKSLNENVINMNGIYEAQLQSINDQIATVKYINESLTRIKALYDGTVLDSFVFREETEKMTKQIEALNKVYARLLQAMTASDTGKSI